jgi:hypothetical protein
MKRALLLAITLTSSLARAQSYVDPDDEEPGVPDAREVNKSPDGYVAAGVVTGKDKYELHGGALEGGHRIAKLPLFGRVMGVAGTTSLRSGRGTYTEARGGVEARTCSRTGRLCGSVGLDLGIHRASFTPYVQDTAFQKPATTAVDPNQFDSFITVPRLTLDGGNRVRVRGVLEFPRHDRDNEPTVTGVSVSLALGVAY